MIENPILNALSASELNFTWLAPPANQQNGIITYYIIVFTEVTTSKSFQYTSNVTSLLVNNLHPYYTYNIKIAAVTIEPGPFLSGISLTMPEAGTLVLLIVIITVRSTFTFIAPSSSPTALQIASVDSKSFSVTWLPPLLQDRNGIIRQYRLLIYSISSGSIIYNLTTVNQHAFVSSLQPYSSYNLSVSAYTVYAGPYSNFLMVTTEQDSKN